MESLPLLQPQVDHQFTQKDPGLWMWPENLHTIHSRPVPPLLCFETINGIHVVGRKLQYPTWILIKRNENYTFKLPKLPTMRRPVVREMFPEGRSMLGS